MNASRRLLALACALALAPAFVWSRAARAGGPIALPASGRPAVWPNGGRNIVYRTDLGGLGTMTNAEAVALTEAALIEWEAVPTSTVSFVDGGPLPEDVDVTNFAPYLFGPVDAGHPVIYDEDGAILGLLFGDEEFPFYSESFTTITLDQATGEIVDGTIVLNGSQFWIDPAYPETAAYGRAVAVQEIGHFVGLDHSEVNGDLWGSSGGLFPLDTFPPPDSLDGLIETMFPIVTPGWGQETPAAADRAALSTLYPEPDFLATTGTITGRVLHINSRTPLNGVNVIARNLADPYGDAISAVSGALAGPDPDDPLAGVYSLNGLTPGAQYAVYVSRINFYSPFSTTAREWLPGPEEFYNGAAESSDPAVDDPGEYAPVTARAGDPVTGADVIFNRLLPGPIPFATRSPELLIPFEVELGGRSYDTVFVNMEEGTLTFDGPELFWVQFGDRVRRHLTGPPRIAGLMGSWLASGSDGAYSFEQTADTFTVRWNGVRARLPDSIGDPSTFSITLHAKNSNRGNLATLTYGGVDMPRSLVGYSCGESLTSRFEVESDLGALANRTISDLRRAAIFEEFSDDFDLAHRSVTFELPAVFADRLEPNDSAATARRVQLPFDTAAEYTDLGPEDTDCYRFRARAGELLLAETVLGAPAGLFEFQSVERDTQIELFGPDGSLLASNDDVAGLTRCSRLMLEIPADGEYTVAVTTGPLANDAGAGVGRYVLTLDTYRGTPLPLDGDDLSVEVPLGFAFPFQGQTWQSVWVSTNGCLTFGAPEVVQTRSDLQLEGFLSGPPRIAPFFTDLDPSGIPINGVDGPKGLILAEQGEDSLKIHWLSVPILADYTTNTFSVTLTAEGDVTAEYGAAYGMDLFGNGTVVGVTAGDGAADPGPTDLSRAAGLPAGGTAYERYVWRFLAGPDPSFVDSRNPSFDLAFRGLRFSAAAAASRSSP
jgi:hypothetical protein